MVRKIITIPNETLRKASEPVEDVSKPEIQAVIHDLKETINADKNAAGLAAPQINEPKRIFAYKDPQQGVWIFVNPEITHKANKKSPGQEACLSVPEKAGIVLRPRKVIMKAQNPEGEKFKTTEKGFAARVLLHEYDHLEGVLFIDKAEKVIDASDKDSEPEV